MSKTEPLDTTHEGVRAWLEARTETDPLPAIIYVAGLQLVPAASALVRDGEQWLDETSARSAKFIKFALSDECDWDGYQWIPAPVLCVVVAQAIAAGLVLSTWLAGRTAGDGIDDSRALLLGSASATARLVQLVSQIDLDKHESKEFLIQVLFVGTLEAMKRTGEPGHAFIRNTAWLLREVAHRASNADELLRKLESTLLEIGAG